MFEPDKNNPKYPVFRKLDGRLLPGLSKSTTLVIVIVLIIGIIAFHSLGNVKHVIEVPISKVDVSSLFSEYRNEQLALEYTELKELNEELAEKEEPTAEQRAELSSIENRLGTISAALIGIPQTEYERYANKAKEKGITSEMSSAELESFVPLTREEEQPVISDFDRGVWFVGVPIALILIVSWEKDGRSLLMNIRTAVRYFRRPKFYYLQKSEDYLNEL